MFVDLHNIFPGFTFEFHSRNNTMSLQIYIIISTDSDQKKIMIYTTNRYSINAVYHTNEHKYICTNTSIVKISETSYNRYKTYIIVQDAGTIYILHNVPSQVKLTGSKLWTYIAVGDFGPGVSGKGSLGMETCGGDMA